jgi:hypothetical protein
MPGVDGGGGEEEDSTCLPNLAGHTYAPQGTELPCDETAHTSVDKLEGETAPCGLETNAQTELRMTSNRFIS